MSKTILITGGTGFVGSNLIQYLNSNYEVINLGRNKNHLCKNIYWDLKEQLDKKINFKVDVIIHCASIVGNSDINKSEYIDINVKSTLELLEFCYKKRIKKFIYISTGGVYGYNKDISNEEDCCSPIDIYSLSKYFSEQLCDLYNKNISIIILRLFFPYGNSNNTRLINNLIENIKQEKEITLNKNGLPLINPIHISDVINVLSKLVEVNCEGTFNLCGDEYISIENLCYKIASILKKDNLNLIYKDKAISNLIGSNSKICELLNYKMSTNLNEGIKRIILEYR
ncbi:NAD(P)-dependent oxidoreductase [Clostridium intestinale]|uniref:NAD-dependent epimerase/dehydratase family protein n=1 Tax=Clostridium intestinale TaxID=36845 RepID=UPI0028E594A1|nr:NAD(P)-dependent oxidoreductase [Clostridium intestinale]